MPIVIPSSSADEPKADPESAAFLVAIKHLCSLIKDLTSGIKISHGRTISSLSSLEGISKASTTVEPEDSSGSLTQPQDILDELEETFSALRDLGISSLVSDSRTALHNLLPLMDRLEKQTLAVITADAGVKSSLQNAEVLTEYLKTKYSEASTAAAVLGKENQRLEKENKSARSQAKDGVAQAKKAFAVVSHQTQVDMDKAETRIQVLEKQNTQLAARHDGHLLNEARMQLLLQDVKSQLSRLNDIEGFERIEPDHMESMQLVVDLIDANFQRQRLAWVEAFEPVARILGLKLEPDTTIEVFAHELTKQMKEMGEGVDNLSIHLGFEPEDFEEYFELFEVLKARYDEYKQLAHGQEKPSIELSASPALHYISAGSQHEDPVQVSLDLPAPISQQPGSSSAFSQYIHLTEHEETKGLPVSIVPKQSHLTPETDDPNTSNPLPLGVYSRSPAAAGNVDVEVQVEDPLHDDQENVYCCDYKYRLGSEKGLYCNMVFDDFDVSLSYAVITEH